MSSLRSQNSLNLVLAPTQHPWPCQILSRNIILPQLGFLSHLPLSWLKGKEMPRSKWTAPVSLGKWGLLDTLSGPGRNAGYLKHGDWGGLEALPQAGSLAGLIWNLLPMEENACCCWEGLLHSQWNPRDVLSSHLPAAGPSHVQQRGVCSCAHRLCQKGFWASHGSGCCLQHPRSSGLGAVVSPLLWLCQGIQWGTWERMLPAAYQVSLEPKWERKNNIKI